jgi:hypothetical protein
MKDDEQFGWDIFEDETEPVELPDEAHEEGEFKGDVASLVLFIVAVLAIVVTAVQASH